MAMVAFDLSKSSTATTSKESWEVTAIKETIKKLQDLTARLSENGYWYVTIMQKKEELLKPKNDADNNKQNSKETTEAEQIKKTLLRQMHQSQEFHLPDRGALITALNMFSLLNKEYAVTKHTLLNGHIQLKQAVENIIGKLQEVAIPFSSVIYHLKSFSRTINDVYGFLEKNAHKTDAEEAESAPTGVMYIPGGPTPLPVLNFMDDLEAAETENSVSTATTATAAVSVATKVQNK